MIIAWVFIIAYHVFDDDKFLHASAWILFGGIFIHIVGTFLYALIASLFDAKDNAKK